MPALPETAPAGGRAAAAASGEKSLLVLRPRRTPGGLAAWRPAWNRCPARRSLTRCRMPASAPGSFSGERPGEGRGKGSAGGAARGYPPAGKAPGLVPLALPRPAARERRAPAKGARLALEYGSRSVRAPRRRAGGRKGGSERGREAAAGAAPLRCRLPAVTVQPRLGRDLPPAPAGPAISAAGRGTPGSQVG